MSERTKAPWRWSGGSYEMLLSHEGEAIAIGHSEGGIDCFDDVAHLIAAAPEMLEALERAAYVIRTNKDSVYGATDVDIDGNSVIDAIDAAIKKARGTP